MKRTLHQIRVLLRARILEMLLASRALLFLGRKYTCPCCGWRLRAFTRGGTSSRVRFLGYCPRCNSKARHRRDWLFLQSKTNLFSDRLKLLHVCPNYCLSRLFIKMPNVRYFGIADTHRLNTCLRVNLDALPIRSDTFDAVLCTHVLEHVENDSKAMLELFRVLKPGGWAFISVPINLNQKTYEDPTITEPQARRRAFGETVHVRLYGCDLIDRLQVCGFQVRMDLAREVDLRTRQQYGLRDDENIFFCTKPSIEESASR